MRATKLLRVILSIQDLFVRGFEFEPRGLVVDVVPTLKIPRCGECGSRCNRTHDRRTRRWRHLDLAGMTVHIQYAIRRVHCGKCLAVKTERVPWASPGCNFTAAFEERTAYLAQQCSKTAVTALMRVAWRTVGQVIGRVVDGKTKVKGDRLDGLRNIGIDELSYRRHHQYITVVIDHDRGEVVWAARGKSAATLMEFFKDLGPERCAMIENATIDMSNAYISAVTKSLPGARLIFDRFHVQRLAQTALDETRRDEVRAAKSKDEKQALKRTRWPLLKSPWNLGDGDILTLAKLEESNQDIYRGYLLKDSFAAILDGRQVNVARTRLCQWMDEAKASGLPHFVRLAGTIAKHLDGIVEYVRTGFSNGRTEGTNGKIRTITRRAYGFHSAGALISMVFLCCGGVEVTPAHSGPSGFH